MAVVHFFPGSDKLDLNYTQFHMCLSLVSFVSFMLNLPPHSDFKFPPETSNSIYISFSSHTAHFLILNLDKLLLGFEGIDCVCVLTPLDVKRLAEKEDWVVDNEGITSLVRGRRLNNNDFNKTDFFEKKKTKTKTKD